MDEMDALTRAHITAAEATFESDPESRKAEKEFDKALEKSLNKVLPMMYH